MVGYGKEDDHFVVELWDQVLCKRQRLQGKCTAYTLYVIQCTVGKFCIDAAYLDILKDSC